MKDGLRNKVLESGSYLILARTLDKLSSIISVIILARLLVPSEFGLIAIAMVVVTLTESLTAISLEAALIQKKDISKSELNVAWTYGRVIRSFLIIFFIFFSAPYISDFFGEPNLTLILQVLMIGQVFRAFENIGMIIYFKELDFQKDFYISIISRLIRIIVLLIAAYYLRSVWAFVLAYLALNFTSAALSYVFHPFRPKFDFNLNILRSLFNFGGWVFLSQLIKSLYDIIDKSTIGRLMTATFLGYYHIAHRFGNELPNELKSVFNQVLFPLYSIQQKEQERTKINFLLVLKITSFVIFPTITLIFLLSESLVVLFLGNQWIPVISPLKILLITALFRSLVSSTYPLFKGLGYPRYETYLLGISVIFISIFIIPLTLNYGINGAATAVLIGQLAALPASFFFLKKVISIKLFEIISFLTKPVLISVFLALILYCLKSFDFYALSWGSFLNSLFVAMIFLTLIYFVLLKISKDKELILIHNLLISYLRKIRKNKV